VVAATFDQVVDVEVTVVLPLVVVLVYVVNVVQEVEGETIVVVEYVTLGRQDVPEVVVVVDILVTVVL